MLIDIIHSDLKQAQLNKDELKINTLRLLLSEIRYAEMRKGETENQSLSDEEIIAVIQKEVKKRKEAADGFRQGGRVDSAEKEESEAEVLHKYLPEQLSDIELEKIINQAVSETGAMGISDMGKVIGYVLGQVGGSADGARISTLLKKKWST